MHVGSNEHKRIDGVSTDLIFTVTKDNWFRIVTHG